MQAGTTPQNHRCRAVFESSTFPRERQTRKCMSPPVANPSCLVESQKGEWAVVIGSLSSGKVWKGWSWETGPEHLWPLWKAKATSQACVLFTLNTQHLPAEAENPATEDPNGLRAVDWGIRRICNKPIHSVVFKCLLTSCSPG